MVFYQVLLLEILSIFVFLGGIFAYKRKLSKQISLTVIVPIAFILAVIISKFNLFDISGMVMNMLNTLIPNSESIFQSSPAANSLIQYTVSVIVGHLEVVLLFILLLIMFRICLDIVFPIILKKISRAKLKEVRDANISRDPCEVSVVETETEMSVSQMEGAKQSKRLNIKDFCYKAGVVLLGALKGYAMFMFLLLPLVFILNLTIPAHSEMEKFEDMTAMEELERFTNELIVCADDTVVLKMSRYTGFYSLNTVASNVICSDKLVGNAQTYEINSSDTLSNILILGVDGLALCENFIQSDILTEETFLYASQSIDRLINIPIALEIVAEIIDDIEPDVTDEDHTDIQNQLLVSLKNTYGLENHSYVKDDLVVISNLLMYLRSQAKDMTIDQNDIANDMMLILQDEEKSSQIVNILADSHIFIECYPTFTAHGIEFIGNGMDLYNNKKEHYDHVIISLAEALNDRTVGNIDFDAVQLYIAYVEELNLDPNQHIVQDENNLDEIDYNYKNYKRYIKRLNNIQKAIVAATPQEDDLTQYFVSADGAIYYLFEEEGGERWKKEAPADFRAGTLIASILLKEAGFMQNGSDDNITYEHVVQWVQKLTSEYISDCYSLNSVDHGNLIAEESSLALNISSVDLFSSDLVYIDEIINNFYNACEKEHFTDQEILQYAKIISSAAVFVGNMDGVNAFSENDVVANFGQLGVLLDAINDFEDTSSIPKDLLSSIRYSQNYNTYFNVEFVDQIIENIGCGISDYESLFYTIQSIYGIIQEIQ